MSDKKLIFILDDDVLYSELLSTHLKKFGFTIELYNSGQECIQNLNKNPYLILLDFNLGTNITDKASGMDVFLKINNAYPQIKIVMISNQKSGKVVLDLIQSGVRDYLEKDSNVFNNLDEIISSYL